MVLAIPQAEHVGMISLAEPSRRLYDAIEDRLQLGRRARNDAQDLRCGRLLFERCPQLAVPCLHLLEQPRVFNRDHGLVGKGIDELDLAFGEPTYLNTPDEDHAN